MFCPEFQEWRTNIASFEDCSVIMIISSYNDETRKDAYGCVLSIPVFSDGKPYWEKALSSVTLFSVKRT